MAAVGKEKDQVTPLRFPEASCDQVSRRNQQVWPGEGTTRDGVMTWVGKMDRADVSLRIDYIKQSLSYVNRAY